MNILIPMAGEGKRFRDNGYTVSKPSIPTYCRHNGQLLPMVVCATMDLPNIDDDRNKIIYVERKYHKNDGTQIAIMNSIKNSSFIEVEELTEGQACTCLLAKKYINNDDELLIAGCDNGMIYDKSKFDMKCKVADVIVFTYRHNSAVLHNPNQYGWMIVDDCDEVKDISIKKAVSDMPMEDHAVVATFWFKRGSIFVEAAERMIDANDRINNEFYVDQAIKHVIELGYSVKVFEIDRYIGWGTPEDYEVYQKTFEYWKDFYNTILERNI